MIAATLATTITASAAVILMSPFTQGTGPCASLSFHAGRALSGAPELKVLLKWDNEDC
jgi:hypothetical protein